MLKRIHHVGRFDFHQNCSLIHHVLQGEVLDGYPVIAFPKEPAKVLRGREYQFVAKPTTAATYVIENLGRKTTYRVVHAIEMHLTDNSEADFVDAIVHRSAGGGGRTTIGKTLPDETLADLEALKSRLQQTS